MTLRITYCDGGPDESVVAAPASGNRQAPHYGPGPAYAEWDDSRVAGLLLYLADEPEIGQRFTYGGATWEIIDYHDGWVAQLVV